MSNVLSITFTRNELLASLTCQAANSNLSTPVFRTISVDLNCEPQHVALSRAEHSFCLSSVTVKPQEVQIIKPVESMTAGQRVELVCQAKGSKPPAKINWIRGNSPLDTVASETTSDDGFVTTGFLSLVPTLDDDRKSLHCAASNPYIADFAIQTHFVMNVSRECLTAILH